MISGEPRQALLNWLSGHMVELPPLPKDALRESVSHALKTHYRGGDGDFTVECGLAAGLWCCSMTQQQNWDGNVQITSTTAVYLALDLGANVCHIIYPMNPGDQHAQIVIANSGDIKMIQPIRRGTVAHFSLAKL